MSKNLERLLTILKAEADVVESINKNVPFRYKSNQRLILENGKPFLKIIKPTPFKGEPKQCFQNCITALLEHSYLSYCEGYIIDDDLPIAILHAWLVNDKFEVIDPTWDDKDSTGRTYFGVAFNDEFVMDFAMKTKHYGILDSDYLTGYQLLKEGFSEGALHDRFHRKQ